MEYSPDFPLGKSNATAKTRRDGDKDPDPDPDLHYCTTVRTGPAVTVSLRRFSRGLATTPKAATRSDAKNSPSASLADAISRRRLECRPQGRIICTQSSQAAGAAEFPCLPCLPCLSGALRRSRPSNSEIEGLVRLNVVLQR
jgi:hypothetical protein